MKIGACDEIRFVLRAGFAIYADGAQGKMFGMGASEYNIVSMNGSMPVLYFTLHNTYQEYSGCYVVEYGNSEKVDIYNPATGAITNVVPDTP